MVEGRPLTRKGTWVHIGSEKAKEALGEIIGCAQAVHSAQCTQCSSSALQLFSTRQQAACSAQQCTSARHAFFATILHPRETSRKCLNNAICSLQLWATVSNSHTFLSQNLTCFYTHQGTGAGSPRYEGCAGPQPGGALQMHSRIENYTQAICIWADSGTK